MKKFLFIALGSYGDILPFVGLSRTLQKKGHQVTLAANPYFKSLLAQYEIAHLPLGHTQEYMDIMQDRRTFTRLHGPTMIAQFIAERIEQVFVIARDAMERGETVVGGILAMGARVAQETTGAPYVSLQLAPSAFWSIEAPPKFPVPVLFPKEPKAWVRATYKLLNQVGDYKIKAPINAFRSRMGLAPIQNIWSDWIHSTSHNLCMFPPWFASPQSDWPRGTYLTSFPLFDSVDEKQDRELEAFLQDGDPPWVFTAGTGFCHGENFFSVAKKTVERLGMRAVLVSKFSHHFPKPQGTQVFTSNFASFSQLLPRCRGLVHHGGIGSTAQALASGIVQVIKPFAFDQFDNAKRVESLGAGKALAERHFNQKKLGKVLLELTQNPTYAQQAQLYQTRLKGISGLEMASDYLIGL